MSDFKEVQRFRVWWAWLAVAGLNVVFIYAVVQQVFLGKPFGSKPAPDAVLIIIQLFFLAFFIFLVSIKLKTRINHTGIYYRFFPFHVKERLIEWHELKDAYMREYNSFHEDGGGGYGLVHSKQEGPSILRIPAIEVYSCSLMMADSCSSVQKGPKRFKKLWIL